MKRFNHISLKQETKNQLDELKAPGQSYDGLLQQLIAIARALMPMPLLVQSLQLGPVPSPDVSQIGLSETVLSSLYPRKETRIAESTKGTAVPYNLS